MIKFITGLPGAGKGVYGTIQIIDELRNTDRHIVTNFAIRMHPWIRHLGRRRSKSEKGLLQHLRDTYGNTYDADKRIHVITDDEMKFFYTWRVDVETKVLFQVPTLRSPDGKIMGLEVDAFTKTLSTCYFVDEAWKLWHAHDWQKTEGGFTFYNAQHRKAGDDLWITSQHSAQLNKQMRILVQEFHTLVNHAYRKIWFFRQPDVISVVVSNEPPETRSKSIAASPKMIKFDRVGVGGSFDTAAGAGVRGTAADMERKKTGLPWWGIVVLLAVLGAGLIIAARGSGWIAGKLLTGGVHKTTTKVQAAGLPSGQVNILGLQMPNTPQAVLAHPYLVPNTEEMLHPVTRRKNQTTYVDLLSEVPGRFRQFGTNWVQQPNTWVVGLSDGRIFKTGDGHLNWASRFGVIIDNKPYILNPYYGNRQEQDY